MCLCYTVVFKNAWEKSSLGVHKARQMFSAFKSKDKATRIGIIALAAMLVLYLMYNALGMVDHYSRRMTPLVVLLFIVMLSILYNREKILQRLTRFRKGIKPIVCLLLIPLSFYLIERPYNTSLFSIPAYYLLLNLLVVAFLFLVVFFVGQQSKTSLIIFLCVCFILGIADYFVVLFKGQPILPADLFALETAAAVGGGYSYLIDDGVSQAYVMLAFGIMLVQFLPAARPSLPKGVLNTVIACACLFSFGFWYSSNDIGESYACSVDVWSVKKSYSEKGSVLCFLKRLQDLSPSVPFYYTNEATQALLIPYEDEASSQAEAFANKVQAEGLSEQPSVLVVMNETFADLSEYSVLSETYAGPSYYQSIDDASLKGSAYVSAFAGGTCNSEFEFLTGSSLASLGGGVYPYVLYDLGGSENLASYYSSLGYKTSAIHPADASNWRRNQVYSQLGFDIFYDIASFDEGTDMLRDLPTDKATYELALKLLAESDEPQFIFDITIQNHSGYKTESIPDDLMVSAPIDGDDNPELNEYLSCIEQSDQDLAFLMDELNRLDRPVVLCFFGDHQPELSNLVASLEFGKDIGDHNLVEIQKRYEVPYMVWKNQSAKDLESRETSTSLPRTSTQTIASQQNLAPAMQSEAAAEVASLGEEAIEEIDGEILSLNYLGALTIQEARLPLNSYHLFLLDLRKEMPALNLNGYMDTENNWHWIGEESIASDAYWQYSCVQYYELFDTNRGQ